MNLFEQFKIRWHRKFSSDKNRAVLLAVSGGADSMVMCDLFLKAKIKFGVAHCNFQLRGEDADGDEMMVKKWVAEKNIPFFFNQV